MSEIKKVLVTTDFSELANHALPYAIKMAKTHEAELIMLHAITLYEHDPNDPRHDFPSLNAYCKEARTIADGKFQVCVEKAGEAGVKIRKEIVQGVSPHGAIIDFIREEGDVGLIVMSTHGRSGLSHVLLGSVTENIIRYAPCPVLVVKKHEHEFIDPQTGEVHIRKILFPLDFSPESLRPLAYLRDTAERNKSQVIIYHAVDVDIPPIYYTSGVESIFELDHALRERIAAKMKEEVGDELAGLEVHYRVGEGQASKKIRQLAEEEKVDLIVVSAAGSHGIGDFLFGSTAARIIQKAVCPVLIV
ncbi:MAG: universal stress protein [Candidatus Krumholzibacteriota bacterium]|nr:universal stress protein [Candidatus Krumholzibacteriota bacterium]